MLVPVGPDVDAWAERAARDAGADDLIIVRFSDMLADIAPPPADTATITSDSPDAPAPPNREEAPAPDAYPWLDPILVMKFVTESFCRDLW